MTFNNLYTSGEEFVLPNGENYVGAYHVHVSKGAMVGGTHTTTPHDRLTPVNSRVAERIKSLQAQLKGQMDSTIKKVGHLDLLGLLLLRHLLRPLPPHRLPPHPLPRLLLHPQDLLAAVVVILAAAVAAIN